MIYRLASRDNINSDKFDVWPAVLSDSFNKFNNKIEQAVFNSEDEILCWLDSRSRTKYSTRQTNVQEFRNGDPNKIYSVYQCDHIDISHQNDNSIMCDKFLYSLRIKKPSEAFLTYQANNERIKSFFKKIETRMDFTNEDKDIYYSSDALTINNEYYEGVYPLDEDPKDRLQNKYIEFVNSIYGSDPENTDDKEFSIVFATNTYSLSWLERFTKKLEYVEKYLEFFARGGDIYVNIEKDPDHDSMIKYIFKILMDNRLDTADDQIQTNVRNMVIDPYLCGNEIFQVRHNRTLLTWHKNYIHIIKKLGLMPSKQFADLIMHFNLMDFFKQIHSKENLEAIIKNVEHIYGIVHKKGETDADIKFIGRTSNEGPKFHKVVKSFNRHDVRDVFIKN